VAGASDGATHATDPEIFNSATGGFSNINMASTNRNYLVISGFSDPTRDGFYLVNSVVSNTQVRIDKDLCGNHTDGFLLNKTNLTWRVYNLTTTDSFASKWIVLQGTGIGGPFHVKFNAGGSPTFQTSPYDDWDAVAHAWKTPARYTAVSANALGGQNNTRVLLFGAADASHVIFWSKTYRYGGGAVEYPGLAYIGDITAFRPTVDTRPVVQGFFNLDVFWRFPYATSDTVQMLAVDNTQTTGRIGFPSHDVVTQVLNYERVPFSYYSGKLFRVPYLVVNPSITYNEIRGYLKDLETTHTYAIAPWFTPFGENLNRFRLNNASIPWNGSRQYRYLY
jgi:hypothetical protein